jgi:hypothetical protein
MRPFEPGGSDLPSGRFGFPGTVKRAVHGFSLNGTLLATLYLKQPDAFRKRATYEVLDPGMFLEELQIASAM